MRKKSSNFRDYSQEEDEEEITGVRELELNVSKMRGGAGVKNDEAVAWMAFGCWTTTPWRNWIPLDSLERKVYKLPANFLYGLPKFRMRLRKSFSYASALPDTQELSSVIPYSFPFPKVAMPFPPSDTRRFSVRTLISGRPIPLNCRRGLRIYCCCCNSVEKLVVDEEFCPQCFELLSLLPRDLFKLPGKSDVTDFLLGSSLFVSQSFTRFFHSSSIAGPKLWSTPTAESRCCKCVVVRIKGVAQPLNSPATAFVFSCWFYVPRCCCAQCAP